MKAQLGQLAVFELGDRLLRSWWTIVAGICLGISAAVLVLQTMPSVFEATARLSLNSKKLAEDYQVPSTVASDLETQLLTLNKNVTSRANLEPIVAKHFDLPRTEDREALFRAVRSGIRVEFLRYGGGINVAYRDSDPRRAAGIANMLAEVYLEEYVSLRGELAAENTRALENLLDSAFEELQLKEREIRDFKRQHAGELSEDLAVNQRLLGEHQQELEATLKAREEAEQRIRSFRDQQDLEESLTWMSGGTTWTSEAPTETSEVSVLRRQLAELRIRYADSHPEVQALKRRIEDLENAAEAAPSSPAGAQKEGPPPATGVDLWRGLIRKEQRTIEELKVEERRLREVIREDQARIDRTGPLQQELDELSMGLDILRRNYGDFRRRVELAQVAEIAERNRMSGELVIQHGAVPPSKPVSPKPLPILGLSALIGLVIFVGPILAKWFLVPVVGSEAALRSLSDVPVLVSVPLIDTPAVARQVRRRWLLNIGLSLLSMTLLAGVTATRLL
jgi:polysaccharide chain length determinant protein (PEP-CTERM system associated)